MLRLVQGMILLLSVAFSVYLFFLVSERREAETELVLPGESIAHEDLPSIEASEDQSQVELRDFNRIEVRGGRKIWEVQARNAKFFEEEGLTHVSDVDVEIYRENRPSVKVRSKGARLSLDQDLMKKADLEGDIKVRIDESLSLKAEFATYDSVSRIMEVPGHVTIYGSGYELTGEGFEMNIDGEGFVVRKNVRTMFRPGAKIPKDLQFGALP